MNIYYINKHGLYLYFFFQIKTFPSVEFFPLNIFPSNQSADVTRIEPIDLYFDRCKSINLLYHLSPTTTMKSRMNGCVQSIYLTPNTQYDPEEIERTSGARLNAI